MATVSPKVRLSLLARVGAKLKRVLLAGVAAIALLSGAGSHVARANVAEGPAVVQQMTEMPPIASTSSAASAAAAPVGVTFKKAAGGKSAAKRRPAVAGKTLKTKKVTPLAGGAGLTNKARLKEVGGAALKGAAGKLGGAAVDRGLDLAVRVYDHTARPYDSLEIRLVGPAAGPNYGERILHYHIVEGQDLRMSHRLHGLPGLRSVGTLDTNAVFEEITTHNQMRANSHSSGESVVQEWTSVERTQSIRDAGVLPSSFKGTFDSTSRFVIGKMTVSYLDGTNVVTQDVEAKFFNEAEQMDLRKAARTDNGSSGQADAVTPIS